MLYLARPLGRVVGLKAVVGVSGERLDDVEHARLHAAADVEGAGDIGVGGARGSRQPRRRRTRSRASARRLPKIFGVAALEQLAAEDRDHAGLAQRVLARPVDVAVAERDGREAVQAREQGAVVLGAELREAVGRLGRDRVVLRGRDDLALAVDGAAGGGVDDAAHAGRRGGAQHVDRALDVHARVERGVGHRPAHVDLSGKVEDRPPARRARRRSATAAASRMSSSSRSAPCAERAVEVVVLAGGEVVDDRSPRRRARRARPRGSSR